MALPGVLYPLEYWHSSNVLCKWLRLNNTPTAFAPQPAGHSVWLPCSRSLLQISPPPPRIHREEEKKKKKQVVTFSSDFLTFRRTNTFIYPSSDPSMRHACLRLRACLWPDLFWSFTTTTPSPLPSSLPPSSHSLATLFVFLCFFFSSNTP